MTPAVAICIPTYNQQAFLTAAVESAFAQTYPNIQVLVRDDASTDGTREILEALKVRYPTLRVERAPFNVGIGETVTWLFKNIDCPYVVRLDSDDTLSPDYVSALLPLMEDHPSAGYAHSAIQEIDGDGMPTRIRRLAREIPYQSPDESLRALLSGYRVSANILLFRRTALEQVDFLNGFPRRAEDYLLAVRLADIGFGNVYSPRVLASYRVWRNQWILSKRIEELEGLNRVFHEGLRDAFKKRGWNTRSVSRHAARRACSETDVLRYGDCQGETAVQAERLLRSLGDGPALSIQIWLMRNGFGNILSARLRADRYLRQWLKEILYAGTRQ